MDKGMDNMESEHEWKPEPYGPTWIDNSTPTLKE